MLKIGKSTFCASRGVSTILVLISFCFLLACQSSPPPVDELAKLVDAKLSVITVPDSAPAYADGVTKVPVYFYAKDSGGNPLKGFKPELGVIGEGLNTIHCEPMGAEYSDCSLTSTQGGSKIIYSKNVTMLKSVSTHFFENPLLGKMMVKAHQRPANGFAAAIIEVQLKTQQGGPRSGVRPQLHFEDRATGSINCSQTSEAGIAHCLVTATEPGVYKISSEAPPLPSVDVEFVESRFKVVEPRAYAGKADSFVRLIVKGHEVPYLSTQPGDVEVSCNHMSHGETSCKLSSKVSGTKLVTFDSDDINQEVIEIQFVDEQKNLRYFSEQEAVADGLSEVEVEVQLKDAAGVPMMGIAPVLEVIGVGKSQWRCGSPNAEGKVKCYISSTEPGVKVIQVRSPAIKESVEIEFSSSPIIVKRNDQPANGLSPAIVELVSQTTEGVVPFLDVRGPAEGQAKFRCLPFKKYSAKDEVRSLCFIWALQPGRYKVTGRNSSRGQVELKFTDPLATVSLLEGDDAIAKADGTDKIRLQIVTKNEWGFPQIGTLPILEVTPLGGVNVNCSVVGLSGVASCILVSSRSGSFTVKVRDPDVAGQIEVLFRNPHGGLSDPSPKLGIINATEAIADTTSKAVVHLTLKDDTKNSIIGFVPRISIEGDGVNTGTCLPSNINGISRCEIASTEVGTKTIRVNDPPMEQSVIVKFQSKQRTCVEDNAAETRQEWVGPDFKDWSSCQILRCNENYSLSAKRCVPKEKVCDPLPFGAEAGVQTWNSRNNDKTWGDCKITACLPHYKIESVAGEKGNACVPEIRDCPAADVPKQFIAGTQTWMGEKWGECQPSACQYPNKVKDNDCVTADVTPVIKGKLVDVVDADPGEEYISETLVIADIDRNIPFLIEGGTDANLQLKSKTGEWINRGRSASSGVLKNSEDGLKAGDEVRIVAKASAALGTQLNLGLSLGNASPINWSIETKAETPPPNALLTHVPNRRTFQISWDDGGVGNGGANNCQVQYYNGKVWSHVGELFNCDQGLEPTAVTLPGDGWVSEFSSSGVVVRMIRLTDQAVIVSFSNKLTCVPDSVMPGKNDPERDENCDGRWVDEDDTSPPEKGDFSIEPTDDGDSQITGTSSVNLKISCGVDQAGEVEVAFGNSPEPSNWAPCVSQKPHIMSDGGGLKKVYMRFKDRYANVTKDVIHEIVVDDAAPVGGTVKIEKEAKATKSNRVLLEIECPRDESKNVERAIGETSEPNNWKDCRSQETVDLSKGEGEKNIFVRFRDRFGNISDSLKTTVIVDQSGPISHLSLTSGWINATQIELQADVRDELGSTPLICSIEAQEKITEGVDLSATSFGPLQEISQSCQKTSFPVKHGSVYRFRAKAYDALGNLGPYSALSSEVRVDRVEPTITNATATTNRSQPACEVVRVTINGAVDAMAGLNEKAYSFDGGKSWQTNNFRDFETTNLLLPLGHLQVRDAAGNIYIYDNHIKGYADPCRHAGE